jgi:hypothetical protein
VLVYALGMGNYMLTSMRKSRGTHVENLAARWIAIGRNGSERANYNDLTGRSAMGTASQDAVSRLKCLCG